MEINFKAFAIPILTAKMEINFKAFAIPILTVNYKLDAVRISGVARIFYKGVQNYHCSTDTNPPIGNHI